ncbi:tripartite tricarboxylate transporter permease [Natronomonas gomsonensis]|uniref:tripartite tricarboxylate transporter permease n=1 Tax=Natronomonas gomsonensis TaxID=1046043 RepID=UPI0020CA4316|nr:tripartite tricarboxylate transporter permease [Natronomonas gomsonensis]MCY4730324.1 tripartite tricarboxylate transporter permease [Natronomonas gomsonensis]
MELLFGPRETAIALGFVLGGVALGTTSGLVPGLHANNMALVLAGVAPSVPGPPLYVGMAMLSAGVVHTFLDIVPALALGVPDAAVAVTALPGHRLVLEGRGHEALRLSALGSGTAVTLAAPLAIPLTRAMTAVWPTVRSNLVVILLGVVAVLVLTERGILAKGVAVVSLTASGLLGLGTLELSPEAPLSAGGMLAPLFAGLFGAPVLLDALDGDGVPPQDDAGVALSKGSVAGLAGLGTVSGAVVGYVPAVSSAIASTLSLLAVPGRHGARGFVVTTSGVNTANCVFALFALVALGAPRTGVLVAVESAGVPLSLPHLLVAVGVAAAVGFVAVPVVGDRYLLAVGRMDPTRLSVAVLAGLGGLSWLFAGGVGVAAYVAATIVGLVPARFGARRANLMGVLIGPIVVG